jgi:hypothetical protein
MLLRDERRHPSALMPTDRWSQHRQSHESALGAARRFRYFNTKLKKAAERLGGLRTPEG